MAKTATHKDAPGNKKLYVSQTKILALGTENRGPRGGPGLKPKDKQKSAGGVT